MQIAYCSFDVFPSPKGAATHIDAFVRALGDSYGGVELVTLAEHDAARRAARPWLEAPAARAHAKGVTHHGLAVHGSNLITRAMCFRSMIASWWGKRRARIAHVRSIYEGYPIASRKAELCDRLVYEVNGLPSIELKYHHPDVAEDDELLGKLRAQERRLAQAADVLLTVSEVTAEELVRRGCEEERIVVIQNGVDDKLFHYREPPSWQGRPPQLIYVGTMTSWQGVHHLLDALRLLRRDHPAVLTLIGPVRKRQRRKLEERAEKLGVAEHLRLLAPVKREELVTHYHAADVALVPLVRNDRNLVQGCCPLKQIEAMAAGVPLVASAMPVTRALASDDEAIFVRPGSAKAIKDGILQLLAEPSRAARMARAARDRVERELTWTRAGKRLVDVYAELM